MAGQPMNKWVQTIFWPISCLPSFGHIPKHAADDYVSRTSPLLGTAFAFWICAAVTVVMYLISNGIVLPNSTWRGADTLFTVSAFFLALLYLAGFFMFATREDQYPN